MKQRKIMGLLVAGTILSVATPASAQIGTCPLITPAPCITYDYKRMSDWATTHAQDLQKLQETVAQIRELEASVKTLGTTLQNIPQLSNASTLPNIAIEGKSFTTFNSAVASFAPQMFHGEGRDVDGNNTTSGERMSIARAANAEGFAYAQQNCRMIRDSRRRMRELHASARRSADVRGDWNVNSQMRAELARTMAQKNILLAALLEMQSVNEALAVDDDVDPTPSYGANGPAPATPPASVNGQNLINLLAIVNNVRRLLTNTSSVEANNGVIAGNQTTIAQYEQAKNARDAALATLQTRVNAWAAEENRAGQPVIDRVLAELNSMDASTAALRQQPIESLTTAFASRNIDAVALTANNVDPRQFLGTWTDPLKFQNTNAMSDNLARSVFNNVFDRSSEREDFIKLVYAYNDLRLQEAWMRPLAADAERAIGEVRTDIVATNEQEGITITTAASSAKLQELVTQANQLAAVINSTANESEKAQAQQALNDIRAAIAAASTPTAPDPAPGTP